MAQSTPRYLLVPLLVVLVHVNSASCITDAENLLKFKSSLSNNTALSNWNASVNPCRGDSNNWVGLTCRKGFVFALRLENMSLKGLIDVESLAKLTHLRSASFANNSFEGPMPNVKILGPLRGLYLSGNLFSGEIPDGTFDAMNRLRKIYLDRNEFNGKVPGSLVDLPRLRELSLHGNHFGGRIPEFPQRRYIVMDLANNDFEGPIPASLSNLSPSSFAGNKNLCGKPLSPCKSANDKKRAVLIIGIAAGAAILAFVVSALLFWRTQRAKESESDPAQDTKTHDKLTTYEEARMEPKSLESKEPKMCCDSEKLHMVRNDRGKFGLEDLLTASAEILGSGSFGSSYKASVSEGPTLVVKRFRQMDNLGRREFHEHMERIGRLSHPNLLPLVAFYCGRKDEKLLISDYVENGSLACHLHARRAPGESGLDWPTRLRIIKGTTHALSYLYQQFPTLTLPHGHLKSSNVLLSRSFDPLLTDYSLNPSINQDQAQQVLVAFKSPEFNQNDITSRKTDVWNLGILILEILTGRFPANYLKHGRGGKSDLEAWVKAIVTEARNGNFEVFDKEMGGNGNRNCEGEMWKLMRIGIGCCEWDLEKRWDLNEVVQRIEELKDRDLYEEYSFEEDGYITRETSEEEFSLIVNG